MSHLIDCLFSCKSPTTNAKGLSIIEEINESKSLISLSNVWNFTEYDTGYKKTFDHKCAILRYSMDIPHGNGGGLQLYPISSDSFKPWQLATHFFMHSPYSIGHIFFNMFALVIFGNNLEKYGDKKVFDVLFIMCYWSCTFTSIEVLQIEISSLIELVSNSDWEIIKKDGHLILNEIKTTGKYSSEYGINLNTDQNLFALLICNNTPMIGASGAVFGLLAAFGYLFPNTQLMLLFPPLYLSKQNILSSGMLL